MKVFPRVLTLVWVAALFPGIALSARNQAPERPSKSRHAPRTLPLSVFYETPESLPPGKPGDLIRSERAYEYHLSYEASTFRILYHSLSPQGKDIAVSGVVLVPDRTPPSGGWPIIAWGHDFTGSARQCAPSLLKNLNAGPFLSMYISLGYAVVASDYAGLGSNLPHAVFDISSNALDVIYSVPAARAALPQLGSKWVVVGYGQGANVAVGVAETSLDSGDPNFLGAVAIAGVAESGELFAHLAQGSNYSMLVFLAHGIKTVFPEFHVEDILTDNAVGLYEQQTHVCEPKLDQELTANEILRPGWESNRYIKEYFKRNLLGTKPARGPLLVISGEADSVVPSEFTKKAVTRLCGQKDRVVFVTYPGLTASAALINSVSEQTSWIRARFAGLPAPANCP